MNIIYADFETMYSQEFTLKKLTPIEYILDPRFSVTGLAICEGNGEPFWIDGDQVEDYIRCKEDCAFVSHNALFDMCILAFHYKFVPKLVIDTLAMARAMLASELPSLSLKAVAAHLKVGVKGDTIENAMGYDLAALRANPEFFAKYIEYGLNDVVLCRSIFKELMGMGFPRSELAVVDTVTRCALVPQFELDVDLVAQHLSEVRYEKERLLSKAMLIASNPIDKSDIMSNEKFAVALEAEGAVAPMKISRLTNKWTYAFAKTDEAFRALLEHENSRVQVLVAARLGIKSTLDESRSERFLSIGRLTPKIPIPLRYGGAHTHRLSGEWKMNMQNLPRGGKLRQALRAPPGCQVVAGDLSQVEARITAWFAGCSKLVRQFAHGEDVYSTFASSVYKRPITKADKRERFLGKTSILGLGYGMGAPKFKLTVASQSQDEVIIDDRESEDIVDLYRDMFSEIPDCWRTLTQVLYRMGRGTANEKLGPVLFCEETVKLPNGLCLSYRDLKPSPIGGSLEFMFGRELRYIWGGKALENIVQALARIIVMDAAMRIRAWLDPVGVQLALQAHDELVYVAPDRLVPMVKEILENEMIVPPEWGKRIPLACETGVGETYASAK